MLSSIAAIAFTALSTVTVLFQLALVCGAPWGEVTMGGRYRGALPRRIRVAPALSAVLIVGFAAVVLARAGMAFVDLHNLSTKLIWVVVAYCVVGSLVNYITPSKRERALWFPVVAVMLACSLVVALPGL
jgi:hypothetical protein